ncbi:MAG: hypothetical protein ABH859_07215 [Pseudomonadota bacterium]
MKLALKIFIAVQITFAPLLTLAQAEDEQMLNNIRRLRLKQQEQEVVIREQKFVHVESEEHCTPVQQTRQRLRDIEDYDEDNGYDNVTINAGHEELNVTDNHGTINSDINIQIVEQGESRPCK